MEGKLGRLFSMATLLLIVFGFYSTSRIAFAKKGVGDGGGNCYRSVNDESIYKTNTSNIVFGVTNHKLLKIGYKPVPDTCPYVKDGGELNDNFLYKEWCEETFDNGSYIYEAYKNIAFNIEYTPEPNKTDFWQTPLETARLKKGDCEDIVFHFFSQLPPDLKNAGITWGWVIDKRSKVGRAHVWYQLTDKIGQQYVVEGFSKDWNGIIPMEIVENAETRRSIFSVAHSSVSRLASLPLEADGGQIYQLFPHFVNTLHYRSEHEVVEYPLSEQDRFRKHTAYRKYPARSKMFPNMSKEISNILRKLHELFSRYEDEKTSN